jgi:hypothetical protein
MSVRAIRSSLPYLDRHLKLAKVDSRIGQRRAVIPYCYRVAGALEAISARQKCNTSSRSGVNKSRSYRETDCRMLGSPMD